MVGYMYFAEKQRDPLKLLSGIPKHYGLSRIAKANIFVWLIWLWLMTISSRNPR